MYVFFSPKIEFLLKFCVKMIALYQSAQHIYEKREGSGAGCGSEAGSVPLTNGSGSGRHKNMRIRIPNTGFLCYVQEFDESQDMAGKPIPGFLCRVATPERKEKSFFLNQPNKKNIKNYKDRLHSF